MMALFMAIIAFSCSKNDLIDSPVAEGQGSLEMNLNIISEEIISNSRKQNVSTDDFLVSIVNSSNVKIIDNVPAKDLDNTILLNSGQYKAIVTYGTIAPAAWENPAYYGEADFTILDDQITNVDVQCALTNSKVQIIYNDFLKRALPEINVVVYNDSTSLEYSANNSKIGFFDADSLTLVVNKELGSNENWQTFTLRDIHPNDFFIVTFSLAEQGANININIKSTNDKYRNFDLPIIDGIQVGVIPGDSSTVYNNDVNLATQAAVENFGALGITHINGNLTIAAGAVQSLASLSSLQEVNGNVNFNSGNKLESFEGLDNLRKITGSLSLSSLYNTNLTSMEHLGNLEEIGGGFTVYYMVYLTSFQGLSNLQSIGGNFTVQYNQNLINFSGLNSLNTVGNNLIISKYSNNSTSNPKLQSLSGLESLTSVKNDIEIAYNGALKDFCAINPNVIKNIEGVYTVLSNGFNPEKYDLENGYCKQ